MDLTVIIYISIGKKQLTNLYKFGIEHDLTMEKMGKHSGLKNGQIVI